MKLRLQTWKHKITVFKKLIVQLMLYNATWRVPKKILDWQSRGKIQFSKIIILRNCSFNSFTMRFQLNRNAKKICRVVFSLASWIQLLESQVLCKFPPNFKVNLHQSIVIWQVEASSFPPFSLWINSTSKSRQEENCN